jgi:hypothetical protein
MKWVTLCAVAATIASCALAWGSQSLKGTMKAWKAGAQLASQTLDGGGAFDEATARKALEAFVADSRAIDDRLSASTPASRDIKLRFEKFSADAAGALDLIGSRDKFKLGYSRLLGECKSCHDQYAN